MNFWSRFQLLFPILLLVIVCLSGSLVQAQERPTWNQDFEQVSDWGLFHFWNGGPEGTIFPDSTQSHGGQWSARLTRTRSSDGKLTSLNGNLQVDFAGQKLTLRGYMKTTGVVGSAGLWMKQAGPAGSLDFTNLGRKSLKGTKDWKMCEISFPLNEEASTIHFGMSLAGRGTMWVDDLEILVDGVPLNQVSVKKPDPTIVDHDLEFESGSRVDEAALTAVGIDRLVLLGKVWGFLKYHHPAITSGGHHWDFDLFRFLPGYLGMPDEASARQALVTWIDDLGEVPACLDCARREGDWYFEADLNWIQDADHLGQALSERLQWICKNRQSSGDQFYLGINPGPSNPLFNHEPDYSRLDFPDAGYRLLALYRYWNIIAYWSPYRDVIGEPWDHVLEEFVPRLVAAPDNSSYRKELVQLVARVNDSHANVWSAFGGVVPPFGTKHPPFAMRFVQDEAVVFRLFPEFPTGEVDLRIGDVIEAIDNQSVTQMVDELGVFYGASNQATRLRQMSRKFLFADASDCKLKIRRGNAIHEVLVARIPLTMRELMNRSRHDRPGDSFQRLSKDIAYLKMQGVKVDQVPAYIKGARGAAGWILDLRGYPPEMLVYPLGGHLVSKNTIFARTTKCDPSNPGFFQWTKPLILPSTEPIFSGKIVILVDETTQSRSEYHALAFRAADGALVLGSTTAGADGTVSKVVLPGGDYCYITGKGIFNPDFSPTQRVGIIPDIQVLPTIEGVRQGRDEVLEAAIVHLLGRPIPTQEMKELLKLAE